MGFSYGEIKKLVKVSSTTITKVVRIYSNGGLKAVSNINHFSPKSEMEYHKEKLIKIFRSRPPANLKEAAYQIYLLTGVKRGLTQVSLFLRKIGVKTSKKKSDIKNSKSSKEKI